MNSVNNKLILEPYKGSGKIESKVSSGFATIKQKQTLIGLKLLIDAHFTVGPKSFISIDGQSQGVEGTILKKEQTVFFEEEILYSHPVFKKTYECEAIEGKFVIVDYNLAVMVL